MTTYIDNEIIDRVKESIDIVDLISDYVELKRSGSNHVGLCPFHSEKTPSFTVSESKQFYHCFGCGDSGDGITFIMKRENLDFPEAVRFLADKLGIEIKETELNPQYLDEKERAYKINRDSARYFLDNLGKNREALNYLKRRKISPKIIRQFGLGYALDSWEELYKFLLEKGHKVEEIESLGLIGAKNGNTGYYDKFRNRIIFPIIDSKSRVIGFGGRVLDDTMPKYLNSKESIVFNKSNHLYGLNLISKYSDRKKILLVEGYMDVIALFSKGIIYSVASLGTALTDQQAKLLRRYGREVYICYDSDNAGIKASLRAIEVLLKIDVKPKIILLPKGMDPDDYINEYGILEFEKKMLKALNHMDYRIYILKNSYDLNNIEDNIKFTVEAAGLIKSLKSPVEQDAYIEKIANDTGISKEAIEKEIRGGSRRQGSSFSYKNKDNTRRIEPVRTAIKSGHLIAELDLIKIIMEDMLYYDTVKARLGSEEFSNEELRFMFDFIGNQYEFDERLNLNFIRKEALKKGINPELVNKLFDQKIQYSPTSLDEVVEDLCHRIILNKMLKEKESIIKAIEDIDKAGNNDSNERKDISSLVMELTDINNKIKTLSHE